MLQNKLIHVIYGKIISAGQLDATLRSLCMLKAAGREGDSPQLVEDIMESAVQASKGVRVKLEAASEELLRLVLPECSPCRLRPAAIQG